MHEIDGLLAAHHHQPPERAHIISLIADLGEGDLAPFQVQLLCPHDEGEDLGVLVQDQVTLGQRDASRRKEPLSSPQAGDEVVEVPKTLPGDT